MNPKRRDPDSKQYGLECHWEDGASLYARTASLSLLVGGASQLTVAILLPLQSPPLSSHVRERALHKDKNTEHICQPWETAGV